MDGLNDSRTAFAATVIMTHLDPQTCQVKIVGELDNLAWRDLSVFIDNRLSKRDKYVLVDFSELSFADSSSLKLVSGLAQRFGINNCAVRGANPNIRRLLKMSSLADNVVFMSDADPYRWIRERAV
jgi:anti-anti-sigma factor